MIDFNELAGTCISQIESGSNLPFAWFDLGKCYMLQGKAHDAFPAISNAIDQAVAPDDLARMTNELGNIQEQVKNPPIYDLALKLLKIGLAGKFRDKKAIRALANQATQSGRTLDGAVLILAGASDESADSKVGLYRDLMIGAFKDFFGTIISGGTKQGVGKLAGDIQEKYPKIAFSIGYIPEKLPDNIERDHRYSEIRTTPGSRFNIMQPVQYWIDIIAAGIDPKTVSIIGIGGNGLSYFEYTLGVALGAKVAVLESSMDSVRNQSGHLLWKSLKRVVSLPEDPYIIRAFVGTGLPPFPDEIRDVMARALHEAYRYSDSDLKSVQSMKEWDELSPELKHSNYCAVDSVIQKLNELGYRINVISGGDIKDTRLSNEEVEILSEMEHARWMAERLLKGWVYGTTKDFEKKTDPSLVLWGDLSDSMKDIDRIAVRKLPTYLKNFDFELRKTRS